MKPETRLIGFDDGPFTFAQASTVVVGVIARAGGYVEGVLTGEVTVDGSDATDVVLGLLDGSGFEKTAQAVLFNGGALGGFNVIDLGRVHATLSLPAVAVLRDEPDTSAVEAALRKHFTDAPARQRVLSAQPIERVELGTGPCFVRRAGGTLPVVEALLRAHTVRGRTPEPLRIAHLIATAMVEGRSRGA